MAFNNGPSFACGAGQLTGPTTYAYTCTPTTAQPATGLTSTSVNIN